MAKKFNPFWEKRIGSIQEPFPHHTVVCLKCGYLYNRRKKFSKRCPNCAHLFNKKNTRMSEFYISKKKKKIFYGNDLKNKRKYLDK